MLDDLVALDKRHLIHPVVSWRGHEARGVRILTSGKGAYVTDAAGATLIDAFSGLWCVNAGYGQASIVDAVQRQLTEIPYATNYFHYGNEPAIRLAKRLSELAPGNLNRVFFTLGGSDAIDTAIRVIRYYFNVTGRPKKKHMIAFQRGFHGSSSLGSGLTALKNFHDDFDSPTPLQHHIASPYPYRNPVGQDPEHIIAVSVQALKDKVAEIGGENVAALFAEPVQGSGGVLVPPDGWFKAMRDAARDLDILFLADEVITGFGRTGPMFGSEYDGVVPDLMTLAKGLTSAYQPMGALMVSDEMYAAIADGSPSDRAIGHGFTYSGHPASAAAGFEAIRLYTEGGLLANGQKIAPRFAQGLTGLLDHPLVGDVRVRGLLAAVELVTDKKERTKPHANLQISQHLARLSYEKRVIFRAFSDDMAGFAPPLCCSEEDIDTIIRRFRSVLDELLEVREIRMAAA
ncbi:aminotransferase class-III (plasmid) [Rhizobium leguminosarum bv. trifolii WSM2304]|uniref:Aminotransferase class-III n=1 Tax=Rhizobium leguminosarum bv. trifolii (strain WSM2304) TaxID=395492 RepID=A0ABF7QZT2_RHILW|nr:aminotransferase class III-fold pyridoxal phosphate-dependent enzyme [Rhizobium leguminosarum]ACI59712.1 aminotransferase class-III [Rhizobium leguminosarum bv. trifolii WSM2304]